MRVPYENKNMKLRKNGTGRPHERSSTLFVRHVFHTCGTMNATPVNIPAYPKRSASSITRVYQRRNHPRSRASLESSLSQSTTTLISAVSRSESAVGDSSMIRSGVCFGSMNVRMHSRSEEHTSELQS